MSHPRESNETSLDWADRLRKLAGKIENRAGSGGNILASKVVQKFCLAGLDIESGQKIMEQGPPRTLNDAIDKLQWCQTVHQVARQGGRHNLPIANPIPGIIRPSLPSGGWSGNIDSSEESVPNYRRTFNEENEVKIRNVRSSSPDDLKILLKTLVKGQEDMRNDMREMKKSLEIIASSLSNRGRSPDDRGRSPNRTSPRREYRRYSPSPRRSVNEQGRESQESSPSRARSKSPCYGCGRLGHFKSECPDRKSVTFKNPEN